MFRQLVDVICKTYQLNYLTIETVTCSIKQLDARFSDDGGTMHKRLHRDFLTVEVGLCLLPIPAHWPVDRSLDYKVYRKMSRSAVQGPEWNLICKCILKYYVGCSLYAKP